MGYVSAAMMLIGGVKSFLDAGKAKDEARDAAAEEARLEGIVTDAKVKSLDVEERVLAGQTRARAAGSNVKIGTGSPLQVLAEQARTFADEKRVVRQAGASRAAQAQTRGNMIGNQAYRQGIGNAITSASSAFSLIAQANANR